MAPDSEFGKGFTVLNSKIGHLTVSSVDSDS